MVAFLEVRTFRSRSLLISMGVVVVAWKRQSKEGQRKSKEQGQGRQGTKKDKPEGFRVVHIQRKRRWSGAHKKEDQVEEDNRLVKAILRNGVGAVHQLGSTGTRQAAAVRNTLQIWNSMRGNSRATTKCYKYMCCTAKAELTQLMRPKRRISFRSSSWRQVGCVKEKWSTRTWPHVFSKLFQTDSQVFFRK